MSLTEEEFRKLMRMYIASVSKFFEMSVRASGMHNPQLQEASGLQPPTEQEMVGVMRMLEMTHKKVLTDWAIPENLFDLDDESLAGWQKWVDLRGTEDNVTI